MADCRVSKTLAQELTMTRKTKQALVIFAFIAAVTVVGVVASVFGQ